MPRPSPLADAVSDRYRIERELGVGGMATVYLARDLKHDRDVAIKVLHPDLGAALGSERFLTEIRTTAKLQHPHILPLLDSGDAGNGLLYYAMPYVRGETLRVRLERERQLPVAEAVLVAREVADALQHAHGQGIIHRDIKPENILLQDGHALVADFGIALAVQQAGGQRMTQTGLSLGTPQYMSPEQAMGEKGIDARSDVYALGAVAYEMLAGEPPFTGPSIQAIVARLIAEEPRALTAQRKAVPAHVEGAVLKALEKLPADRFATATQFAAALTGTGDTVTAPTGVRAPRATAPRSLATMAAALVIGLGLVGGAFWIGQRQASSMPGASGVVELAFRSAGAPLQSIEGRDIAISPDGSVIAYATNDSIGRQRVYLRALGDRRQLSLEGTDNAMFPRFSPDGKRLAFVAQRQLRVVPIAGGTATPLAELPGPTNFTWIGAGLVIGINDELHLLPSEGGALQPLGIKCRHPVGLVGPSMVACATPGAFTDAELMVVDIASRQATRLGEKGTPVGEVDGQLLFVRADGAMFAVPYDADAHRITGTPHLIVERVRTSNLAAVKAAVSPTGSLVYLSGTDEVEAVLVDSLNRTRPLPIPPGRLMNPRVSPDGRQLLVDITDGVKADVYVYDIANGAGRRLTEDAFVNQRPEWSADGRRILFRTDRGDGRSSIREIRAEGNETPRVLLPNRGEYLWEAVLAPDGETLVYRTGTGPGTSRIAYLRLTGDTVPKLVAPSRFSQEAPTLSPDGRWIAYQTEESGRYEVVARPFGQPGATVPISVGGGRTPLWSRDGRTIYYVNGAHVFSARVRTTPTLVVDQRRELFSGDYFFNLNHATYDAMPDNSGLVMLRNTSRHAEEIVVVSGFAEALRVKSIP